MIALTSSNTMPSEGGQRVWQRSHLFMLATARVRGAPHEYRIKIKDISAGGLRAALDISLFVGTRIEINLRNIGWMPAGVVWTSGSEIGVRFAAQIDPAQVLLEVGGNFGPPPPNTGLRRL